MIRAPLERVPVVANEEERSAIAQIEKLIAANTPGERDALTLSLSLSRDHSDVDVELPETVMKLLAKIIHLLAQGDAVSIVPIRQELTTQQAADLLNVSRQYLVRILDAGDVPFHYTGTHRRIAFGDLMEYKRLRDAKRRTGLARLTRMSQELGLYH
jgi:excisionase family DNA binding protein